MNKTFKSRVRSAVFFFASVLLEITDCHVETIALGGLSLATDRLRDTVRARMDSGQLSSRAGWAMCFVLCGVQATLDVYLGGEPVTLSAVLFKVGPLVLLEVGRTPFVRA